MGITYNKGFQSILCPGSGYEKYDTFRDSLFFNKKQKKEHLIKQLLEKLPLNTIMLDPTMIGKV